MTIQTVQTSTTIRISEVDHKTLEMLRHSREYVDSANNSITLRVRSHEELLALDTFLHLIRKNV